MTLSNQQYERFLLINSLIEEKKPVRVTLEDIANKIGGITEPSAKNTLDKIIKAGYLQRNAQTRAIELTNAGKELVNE